LYLMWKWTLLAKLDGLKMGIKRLTPSLQALLASFHEKVFELL
jgi:hypothetical protein